MPREPKLRAARGPKFGKTLLNAVREGHKTQFRLRPRWQPASGEQPLRTKNSLTGRTELWFNRWDSPGDVRGLPVKYSIGSVLYLPEDNDPPTKYSGLCEDRLFIHIVDYRYEILGDITEEDAKAEGHVPFLLESFKLSDNQYTEERWLTAKDEFASDWHNRVGNWTKQSKDWVVVYRFEVIFGKNQAKG